MHQTQLEEPQILLSGPQIQLEGLQGGPEGIDKNEKMKMYLNVVVIWIVDPYMGLLLKKQLYLHLSGWVA